MSTGSATRAGLGATLPAMGKTLAFASLVVVASTLPAQRTIVVDANNGPGTNYTDFPPAYAAATAGDTILIRSGRYTPSPAPIAKAITIRGDVGGSQQACFSGSLSVAGVAAGQRLLIGNLTLRCSSLDIADCPGAVHIDGVTAAEVSVRRCPQVTFAESYLKQLDLEDATVAMAGGEVFYGPSFQPGLFSVTATRSQLTLGNANVIGPLGYFDPTTCTLYVTPTPGFNLADSVVFVSTSSIIAGGGYSGGQHCLGGYTASIAVGTNSTLQLDPSVQLFGGVAPSLTVVRKAMPVTYGVASSPGTILPVVVFGGAGSPFLTLASLPVRPVPTPFNALWVDTDPGKDILIGTGTVGSNGLANFGVPLPPGIPLGLPMTIQSGVVESGQLALSSAMTLLLHKNE